MTEYGVPYFGLVVINNRLLHGATHQCCCVLHADVRILVQTHSLSSTEEKIAECSRVCPDGKYIHWAGPPENLEVCGQKQ